MSTKQTIIFTFMILFLAGSLFAMGAYFHLSAELDTKNMVLEELKARKHVVQDDIIEGTPIRPGLRPQINDPVKGLKKQLEDARAQAEKAGSETDGARKVEILYDKKGEELEPKWNSAKDKWKGTYDDWKKLNADIDTALLKLKEQAVKTEQETGKAKSERDTEENNEDVARKQMVVDRKVATDEIGKIRASHEEVLDKVSNVTREIRKSKVVAPQGKIIEADESLQTVVVDIGSIQGVHQGLEFDVFSGAHTELVKKGRIQIVKVNATSSEGIIMPPKVELKQDPVTGWVATDPRMKYSIFALGGQDEADALELIKPKTKQDRIDAYRTEKMEKEQGLEEVDRMRREQEEPSVPPVELGKGFVPIAAGDWITNADFVPIVSGQQYQRQTTDELLSMQDVNLSPLTFYFTDSVRAYRKEFLRRLCERNHCKANDSMTADVDYVVTSSGSTRADLLEEKLASSKDKEEVSADIKNQRKTLLALQEGKKIGAHVISEDEMEAFFSRRQRKQELLRGKTVQPGQHSFYVAGETKDRSATQLQRYIEDHGGVIAPDLDANVDYVVVGSGLDAAFYEKIKKLGLRIIREDELPRFFGVGN